MLRSHALRARQVAALTVSALALALLILAGCGPVDWRPAKVASAWPRTCS